MSSAVYSSAPEVKFIYIGLIEKLVSSQPPAGTPRLLAALKPAPLKQEFRQASLY